MTSRFLNASYKADDATANSEVSISILFISWLLFLIDIFSYGVPNFSLFYTYIRFKVSCQFHVLDM